MTQSEQVISRTNSLILIVRLALFHRVLHPPSIPPALLPLHMSSLPLPRLNKGIEPLRETQLPRTFFRHSLIRLISKDLCPGHPRSVSVTKHHEMPTHSHSTECLALQYRLQQELRMLVYDAQRGDRLESEQLRLEAFPVAVYQAACYERVIGELVKVKLDSADAPPVRRVAVL